MSRPYIICSKPLDDTNETLAMHTLCEVLYMAGFDASIVYPGGQIIFNDVCNRIATLMYAKHQIYYNDAVVVYPDNFTGNYLGANHIARFIVNNSFKKLFRKNESIFYFDKSYREKLKNINKHLLIFPTKNAPFIDEPEEMYDSIDNFIKITQC